MTTMTSPTLRLITQQCDGDVMRETQSKCEITVLKEENEMLRRKLAHLTAQYIWTEGGSHAKIDSEIRQYGFRLAKMDNGYDPKIVPITKVVSEANREVRSEPPCERVAGEHSRGPGV